MGIDNEKLKAAQKESDQFQKDAKLRREESDKPVKEEPLPQQMETTEGARVDEKKVETEAEKIVENVTKTVNAAEITIQKGSDLAVSKADATPQEIETVKKSEESVLQKIKNAGQNFVNLNKQMFGTLVDVFSFSEKKSTAPIEGKVNLLNDQSGELYLDDDESEEKKTESPTLVETVTTGEVDKSIASGIKESPLAEKKTPPLSTAKAEVLKIDKAETSASVEKLEKALTPILNVELPLPDEVVKEDESSHDKIVVDDKANEEERKRRTEEKKKATITAVLKNNEALEVFLEGLRERVEKKESSFERVAKIIDILLQEARLEKMDNSIIVSLEKEAKDYMEQEEKERVKDKPPEEKPEEKKESLLEVVKTARDDARKKYFELFKEYEQQNRLVGGKTGNEALLQEVYQKYEQANVEYGKSFVKEKLKEGKSQEEATAFVFEECIVNEKDIFQKEFTDSWPPKEKGIVGKLWEKWTKMKPPVRWVISAGLGAGAVFMFVPTAMAGIGIGAYFTYRLARAALAGTMVLGVSGGIGKIANASWFREKILGGKTLEHAKEEYRQEVRGTGKELKEEEVEIFLRAKQSGYDAILDNEAKYQKRVGIAKLCGGLAVAGAMIGEAYLVHGAYSNALIDKLGIERPHIQVPIGDGKGVAQPESGKGNVPPPEPTGPSREEILRPIEKQNIENLAKLGTVGKGEGVWHAVKRQVEYLTQMNRNALNAQEMQLNKDQLTEILTKKFGLKPEDLKGINFDDGLDKNEINELTGKILIKEGWLTPGGEMRIAHEGVRVAFDGTGNAKLIDVDNTPAGQEDIYFKFNKPEVPIEPATESIPQDVTIEASPKPVAAVTEPNTLKTTATEQQPIGQKSGLEVSPKPVDALPPVRSEVFKNLDSSIKQATVTQNAEQFMKDHGVKIEGMKVQVGDKTFLFDDSSIDGTSPDKINITLSDKGALHVALGDRYTGKSSLESSQSGSIETPPPQAPKPTDAPDTKQSSAAVTEPLQKQIENIQEVKPKDLDLSHFSKMVHFNDTTLNESFTMKENEVVNVLNEWTKVGSRYFLVAQDDKITVNRIIGMEMLERKLESLKNNTFSFAEDIEKDIPQAQRGGFIDAYKNKLVSSIRADLKSYGESLPESNGDWQARLKSVVEESKLKEYYPEWY
ncbi:MAG: hypothetical protein HYW78_02445 [Parcubacteria group bacterium]|nr:hypothetical protein [Parcubacteria group bacterium]